MTLLRPQDQAFSSTINTTKENNMSFKSQLQQVKAESSNIATVKEAQAERAKKLFDMLEAAKAKGDVINRYNAVHAVAGELYAMERALESDAAKIAKACGDEYRRKPEEFALGYEQSRLFWELWKKAKAADEAEYRALQKPVIREFEEAINTASVDELSEIKNAMSKHPLLAIYKDRKPLYAELNNRRKHLASL